MLCVAAPVAAIRQPAGPAHYEAGQVKLADGTTLEVWGDPGGKSFIHNVRTGDTMEICFGPEGHWADEGRGAREGFAVDVRSGVTYTAVGYPSAKAQLFPPTASARRTL